MQNRWSLVLSCCSVMSQLRSCFLVSSVEIKQQNLEICREHCSTDLSTGNLSCLRSGNQPSYAFIGVPFVHYIIGQQLHPLLAHATHSRCDRLTQCHALYAHVMLYMLILQLFMLMFSLVDWIHAHVLACCCSLTVAAANTLVSNQGTGLIHCCSVSADHSQLGTARAIDKKARSVC